jgi:hypothetical protein
MAWARFVNDFEFDFRPDKAVCQVIRASDRPQEWPDRVIAAAVTAGAAERVDIPTDERRAIKRAKGRIKKES